MTNPDFIKLSESMGAKALRVSNLAELPAKMKEFLEYDGTRPIVMECLVSSEHVYPMVPAGKALHEQIVSHNIDWWWTSLTTSLSATPKSPIECLSPGRHD